MLEVIRKEGNVIVLYSKDESKILGRFPFGEGKKYASEETAREAAEKRERQIQFFKSRESDLLAIRERVHSDDWHKCWDKMRQSYNDHTAVAICGWAVSKMSEPQLFEAFGNTKVVLTLEDAVGLDEALAAEMEHDGIAALIIDTTTWDIERVPDGGTGLSFEIVPDALASDRNGGKMNAIWITPEQIEKVCPDCAVKMREAGFTRVNILSEQMPAQLLGGLCDHVGGGSSGFFGRCMDADLGEFRPRDKESFCAWLHHECFGTWPAEESARRIDSESDTRELTETWDRSATQAGIDESGNLYGIVVVEGLSANGNHYTREALETGPAIFAGKPIYADHPTRTEERDRPERSVRDLVGRLPESRADFYVEKITEGQFAGRHALHYRNAKLSATADWLRTLIKEGIAGDQSINAEGRGRGEDNRFVVEAFTAAMSLDFVTKGAAGGRGFVEAERSNQQDAAMESLTFEQLCEARPDIVDTIGQRERRKAYGEKAELKKLKQEVTMSTELINAMEARLRQLKKENAQSRADKIVEAGLAGQPQSVQSHVRQLVEADVKRFVEQEEIAAAPAEPAGELAPVATELTPGDAPTLELPPDVGALPEEAQALWLEAYTAALPEGEEVAVHKAWAAVFDAGWMQDEGGVWVKAEVAAIAPVEPIEPAMAEPMMTEAQLSGRIASLVRQRRAELATLTAAGQVRGMGGQAATITEKEQTIEQQKQSFMDMGLTEAQAEIAVKGR